MFDSCNAVNDFLLRQFSKTVDDIAETSLFEKSVGHGHTPVWLMGHLAIVGEMGQRMLGGKISHPNWLRLFGPGSSDDPASDAEFRKASMSLAVTQAYQQLRSLAAVADATTLEKLHGIGLLDGTSIKTIEHVVTHLLTSHFAFHLAQLSSCRRVAGFGPLF